MGKKKREISKICEWAKKKKNLHDCIIQLVEARIAIDNLFMRDVFGLNCLCVSNKYLPEQWTDI